MRFHGRLYFCYWSPSDYSQGPTFDVYPAIAGVNKTTGEYYKTKHYDEVKRINAVVRIFADYLFPATSTHLVQIGATDDPNTKLSGLALDALKDKDEGMATLLHTMAGKDAIIQQAG